MKRIYRIVFLILLFIFVFTPLEGFVIYGGDDINPVRCLLSNRVNKNLIPYPVRNVISNGTYRKGEGFSHRLIRHGGKAPSFLTGFTSFFAQCQEPETKNITPEDRLHKLLEDESAFRIVFDLSEIKEDLNWHTSGKVFYSNENILFLQDLELKNPLQDFELSIKSTPVIFDLAKFTYTLFVSESKWQPHISVNDQLISPAKKVFNLIGRISIKGDNFNLKAKSINWQELDHKTVIKVFYWLKAE